MNPSVLLIITGDPRASHRPAEAIRIAAGVGAWKKVQITLYLSGDAARLLSEDTEEFVDEDNYRRYLPMIAESGHPIYLPHGAPVPARPLLAALRYQELSDHQFAELAANSTYVMRF